MLLALLDRNSAVLVDARIDLHALLVRLDVQLNTSGWT